jgi:hypothetical protein
MSADHLSHVARVHAQLEYGHLFAFHGTNLNPIRIVHESLYDRFQEISHLALPRSPIYSVSCKV